MAERFIFVPHTHWDREWYYPFEVFREKLVLLVDRLIGIMNQDPAWKYFLLDGQTIVLEDYLEIKGDYSELLKLVKDGRIGIGPWYDLPDEFLVTGESIIRNLKRGFEICRKLEADPVKVGYLPDMFGHISQMPQIFNGFGIKDAVVWRGTPAMAKNQFTWKTRDGSSVFAVYLPLGYGFFYDLPESAEEFVERFKIYSSLAKIKDPSGVYLMQPGTDHWAPDPQLPAILKKAMELNQDWQLEIAGLEQYFSEIKKAAGPVPEYQGELRSVDQVQILPSVASSRLYLKQMNHRASALLEKYLEPLSALAWMSDGQSIAGRLDYLWKLLLSNHPHDSICGCSIDPVHAEMETRYRKIFELAQLLLQKTLARASDVQAPRVSQLSVWNPNGKASPAVVEFKDDLLGRQSLVLEDGEGKKCLLERIERLNKDELMYDVSAPGRFAFVALGWFDVEQLFGLYINEVKVRKEPGKLVAEFYVSPEFHNFPVRKEIARVNKLAQEEKVVTLQLKIIRKAVQRMVAVLPGLEPAGISSYKLSREKFEPAAEVTRTEKSIENSLLKVEALDSGLLKITDKQSGKEIMTGFSDRGDRGDLYNFDPVPGDAALTVAEMFRVKPGPAGKTFAALDLEHGYRVPASLEPSRDARSGKKVALELRTRVFLYAGVRRVDFETGFENTARDHRLQAEFWFPEKVDSFRAESGFDLAPRKIAPEKLPEKPGAADLAKLILGSEANYASGPIQNFACLEGSGLGMTIAARGIKEVEAANDLSSSRTRLSLTLCRAVGYLARPDLAYRTGLAGPPLETPGGQCLRQFNWDYSVIFWSGPLEKETVFADAWHFVFPPLMFAGRPAAKMPFLVRGGTRILLSALYPAKDGRLIARFFNSGFEDEKLELVLSENVADAVPVNLEERVIAHPGWKKSGTNVETILRPGEIFTLALDLARKEGAR